MIAMLFRSVGALLVVATLFSGVARADDRAKAKEQYRLAIKHYRLGEFDQALESFKEAYRNYSDGSFLFNIGMCHRQLGHKQEAVQAFKSFLAEAPNAPNRDDVVQLIATIQGELDAEQKAVAPPPPEVKPAPVDTTPAVVVAEPAPVPERKPVYKKWWLWTTIGGVVVVGLGVGLGVGLTRHSSNGNTFPGVGF